MQARSNDALSERRQDTQLQSVFTSHMAKLTVAVLVPNVLNIIKSQIEL